MDIIKQIEKSTEKFKKVYESGKGNIITVKWGEGMLGCSQVEEYEDTDGIRTMEIQAHNYNEELSAVEAGFDNVPTASFFGSDPYMITLAYGCPMKYQGDLLISTYKYKNVEEAKNFEYMPKIYEHGLYKLALDRIKIFGDKYPNIPIALSDVQSPIDVITEFLPADEAIFMCYDEPELAHHILNGITQSIIDVCHQYKKVIKNFAGFKAGAYIGKGIHVSDDNAAFLSPEIYADFAKPYAEKLSDEFGGISFHVCMGFEQNLKSLAQVKGFLGYDAMPYYNNPKLVFDTLGKNKVYNLYDYPWTRPMDELESSISFYKRIIDINEKRNALRIDIHKYKKEDALRLGYEVKNYILSK